MKVNATSTEVVEQTWEGNVTKPSGASGPRGQQIEPLARLPLQKCWEIDARVARSVCQGKYLEIPRFESDSKFGISKYFSASVS